MDDDDSWLRGLGDALAPLSEGSSVVCSLLTRGAKVAVERRVTAPADPELEALTARVEAMIPQALRRKMHLRLAARAHQISPS